MGFFWDGKARICKFRTGESTLYHFGTIFEKIYIRDDLKSQKYLGQDIFVLCCALEIFCDSTSKTAFEKLGKPEVRGEFRLRTLGSSWVLGLDSGWSFSTGVSVRTFWNGCVQCCKFPSPRNIVSCPLFYSALSS